MSSESLESKTGRQALLEVALRESADNPLMAAFLGWLLRDEQLLKLLAEGAEQAASIKGAERSSRSVAILGFACGVESLKNRFSSDFTSQLEWAIGRPNFATGGEPCVFVVDPVTFAGTMAGASVLSNSTRLRFEQWATTIQKDAVGLNQEEGWRCGLLEAVGRLLECGSVNSSVGVPAWMGAALALREWGDSNKIVGNGVVNAALLNAANVNDGFEAGLRVAALDWAAARIDDGITLVLSGGGIRATLFQLGVVAYLAKTGQLDRVRGLVSVSGGSILAAHLAVNWTAALEGMEQFNTVAATLVKFARSDIRNCVLIPWIWSRLNPLAWFRESKSRSGRLRAAYAQHFTKNHLGDFNKPELPDVAFVATDSVRQERIAFTARQVARFPVAPDSIERGHQTHIVAESTGVPLALAVATSSCFPPVFPRMHLTHKHLGLHYSEFKDKLSLNDGGVIGNLGIEVLLSLHRVDWRVRTEVIVVDAERPQGERPGNGAFADLGAQSAALSQAEINMAKQQLGSDVKFIRLSKRQPEPPGLPFSTQTPLHLYRTDLDAPSWMECQALILHGFYAASINIGDAKDYKKNSRIGREIVTTILRVAGCPDELPAPTDTDLYNSKKRPLGSIFLHASLVVGIAVVIALLAGTLVYRMIPRSKEDSDPNIANLPLEPSNVAVPIAVPSIPQESLMEVALLPKIDYRPFEIHSYDCLVDLRQWIPFGNQDSSKTSPVTMTRRIVGVKKEPIEYIRTYTSTEGAGIDIRCLSGQRWWVEHGTATGKPAVNIMNEYHLVVDVSSVPVGTRFEILSQVTTWNGMKAEDPWQAFVAFTDITELKVQLLFPPERQFKTAKFVCYPNQQDNEVSIEGKFKQITSDPRSIFWDIKPAAENTTYEIQWTW